MNNYEIKPAKDGKYIILKTFGTISRHLTVKYYLEAHELGKKLGIDRFLLDFTECRNTDTVLRNYKFVYDDMKNPAFIPTARTALLVGPNDHSHDFIESLFRAAGADFALFREMKLAMFRLMQT